MHKRHRALIAVFAIVALIGGVALAAAVVDQVVIIDGVSVTIDVRLGSDDQADVEVAFRASEGTIANTNQSDNAWIELPASYTIDDDGVISVSATRVREQFPVNPTWPYMLVVTTTIHTDEAPAGTYNVPLRAHVTKGAQVHSASADTATFLDLVPEYIVVQVAQTYTVTYDGNTNDAGEPPVDSAEYLEGAVVTVSGQGTLSKGGHNFVGWNTAADGSGDPRPAGSIFTVGDADVTLYAQWVQAYVVIYYGNGHTAGTPPVDLTLYSSGDEVTVLGPGTLAKAGHAFTGWNTQPGGGGTPYAAGVKLAMGTANVQVYAQWTPVTVGYEPVDEDEGHPAAPAIATALLRQHGVAHRYDTGTTRGKGKGQAVVWGNYISAVARAMGRGASFPAYDAAGVWDGSTYIEKSDAAAYAGAVRNFLVSLGAPLH